MSSTTTGSLTAYAQKVLGERFGDDIRIFGPSGTEDRGGVLSLALGDVHPHDLAQVLDQSGVCVRAGHHCAKPLMRRLGVNAAARASFYVYNDESDVDALVSALEAGRYPLRLAIHDRFSKAITRNPLS